MNSTELIAALRMTAFIGDETLFPDYDDLRLSIELTDALHTTFGRAIVSARQGYWLRRDYFDHLPGVKALRIPKRAIAVEQVAIAPASGGDPDGLATPSLSGTYQKLEELSETHAQDYEAVQGGVGTPQKYVIRGDMIWLLPTPASVVSVRVTYYLRPSRMVAPQAEGAITNIDRAAGEVDVDALPLDLMTNTEIAHGQLIDVVHPDGWHDPPVISRPCTINGVGPFQIGLGILPESDAWNEIRIGDYVRAAEQSEWPPLPVDFHRPLAEVAAIKVMQQLNMTQKAAAQQAMTGADLQRFSSLIQPRVMAEARAAKAPRSVLQVGRAGRGYWGWR